MSCILAPAALVLLTQQAQWYVNPLALSLRGKGRYAEALQ